MFKVTDWSRRKEEIGITFRAETLLRPLPAETDEDAYADLLTQMNISSAQDFAILYSIVEDAIMMARREERPAEAEPLEMFKDWLQRERNG